MTGVAAPTDRFQSFAERYVIERASHYRAGNEQEDAWLALQDAKKIYDMIGDAARVRNGLEDGATQWPASYHIPMQQRMAALQAGVAATPPARTPARKWYLF